MRDIYRGVRQSFSLKKISCWECFNTLYDYSCITKAMKHLALAQTIVFHQQLSYNVLYMFVCFFIGIV